MTLSDLPAGLRECFEQTPDVLQGKLRIRGSRVSVEQVLELLASGASPEQIVCSFPSLDLQSVIAVERLAVRCALTMLWMRVLLDENVPVDILPFLRAAGLQAESANFIGWKGIQNGELIGRARDQFELLLTRDKDFEEEFLRKFVSEKFGIVLLAIPQQPGAEYAVAFSRVWPDDAKTLLGRVSRLEISWSI